MFHSRKIYLAIIISMLASHILLIEACLPKISKMYSDRLLKDKPCNDVRRKKIQVGRNPTRYEDTYDYGPHENCKKDEECPPHFKCEKGCCS